MRARALVAAGVFAAAVAAACPARAGEAAAPTASTAPADPIGRYNLACKKARAGERDAAFAWLDQAIAAGFGAVDVMAKDPNLASLRGDARWPGVVERARARANPCKAIPEARQLDFWVGEWDVHDPQGRLVGRSSIQLILGDCVVLESWSGALGGSGKSMNFWDQQHRRWQQTWVDDRGHATEYFGRLADGSLRYATADGAERLTFTPLAGRRVRQLAESSSDGGKRWTVRYDFTYFRRAP